MEVRQTFRNDGWGEQCVKETVIPDPKPVYPLRHVVDGILFVTLPAADYDALVSSAIYLAERSKALTEEVRAIVEDERDQQEAESQAQAASQAPPITHAQDIVAPQLATEFTPTHKTRRKGPRH